MNQTTTSRHPIFIIGALFFIFGFVTWLNATLIPYLKLACELDNFQSYLVTFAFYIAYFVFAIPSAKILQRTGYKKGMSVGLLVMTIGALVFIPAAITRTYALFLSGLFILGAGLALLQTAANPYVAIIGPMESAARRISIMGVCNKIAGALAPLILGSVVLKDTDQLNLMLRSISDEAMKGQILQELASRAVIPYLCIAAVLVILALLVRFSGLPEIEEPNEKIAENGSSKSSIWKYKQLWLGVAALFFYVGAEVIAVDTITNYGVFAGLSMDLAKIFPTVTMLSMILGYFIGIFLMPKYVSQRDMLVYSTLAGMAFTCAAMYFNGVTSVVFIALLGIAHAPMWPIIWALSLDGLGKFTKTGSSLLIMAIAGGALLPLLYGVLADAIQPKIAYWMLIPCYVVILYYAVVGSKQK